MMQDRRYALALMCAAALLIAFPPAAQSQNKTRSLDEAIQGSATGVSLPHVPLDADLLMGSERAHAWASGTSQRVWLEKDVRIEIGAYKFKAASAVVEMQPFKMAGGKSARRVWVYMDRARGGDGGPVGQSAKRLLVTATLVGKVSLKTSLLKKESADQVPLVVAAMQRMGRHRQALAKWGGVGQVPRPPVVAPPAAQTKVKRVPAQVSFYSGRITYHTNEKKTEGYVQMVGSIQILYVDPISDRRLTLRSDRAVMFTDPNKAEGTTVEASAVRGIYLEGNVILNDGKYTLRGPKIFYDVQADRAVVMKAVFFTWDETRKVPLYVRAEELKQHSQARWSAQNAQLTTSEFKEPHFAIGIDQLMITAEPRADRQSEHVIAAEGVRMKVGGATVLRVPNMSGSATEIPLRRFKIGSSSRRGFTVETQWHLHALLNQPKPEGVESRLLVDGYADRGPGIGVDIRYETDDTQGELFSYYLNDQGVDEPGGRLGVLPPTEHRGRFRWRQRHMMLDDWEVLTEANWLSDANYLEEYFGSEAEIGDELETLLYLKRAKGDTAFTFLAKYDPHNFVPTTDLLQTRGNIISPGDASAGYTTEKLPEIGWFNTGSSFWEDRLTHYSQVTLSVMRLNLPTDAPSERGFTAAESTVLFGMAAPTTAFDQALRADGLNEQTRYRFDTRQEIQAPLQLGDWRLTPYAVGRLTAYDDDFIGYGTDADNHRVWGGAGIKAHTSLSRVDDGARSALFDIHRLRHVIEPSANLLYSDTNLAQQDLAVYDHDVESIAEGTIARVGMRNTWQTQRGGPGRWRSVDVFRLDTDVVFASDGTATESPIAQFVDYRPEYSYFGDHLWSEAAWQVTDTTSFVANSNYSFDSKRFERWTAGAAIDHTPRLTTFATIREIDAVNSSLVRYGFDYMVTPKYHVGISQSFDLVRDRTRNLTFTLTRRLPRWLLIFVADVDSVEGVSSIGVSFVPEGLTGRGKPEQNPFMFR